MTSEITNDEKTHLFAGFLEFNVFSISLMFPLREIIEYMALYAQSLLDKSELPSSV